MKIGVLSKEGDGLGVAFRLQQQGNDVWMYIREPRFSMAGKGIVKKVDTWRELLGKADLILCDMVGFGVHEDLLRRLGKKVISCSFVLEQAELDRGKGMQLFRAVGIEIPETYQFKNVDEASKALKALPFDQGWVIKPDGNIATSKTMVVKDEGLFAESLQKVRGSSLIVQRVVDGVEVSTEGWFNGRDFVKPFNHTFEEKNFLNDNLGPATGCMGNIVLARDSDKLTKATVERLKPVLAQVDYRGPVDVNCIVTKDHAYALEITSRLGYDAAEALCEGLREPVADFLFEVANGSKKEMDITRDAIIAVRLSVPPWPHAKPNYHEHRGEPVTGLTPEVLKHVYLTDLYKEGDRYLTAAGDGVLLKATAVGRPSGDDSLGVKEARNRVYRTLKNIKVGGKQYRTDIGKRVPDAWRQLKEWGWV